MNSVNIQSRVPLVIRQLGITSKKVRFLVLGNWQLATGTVIVAELNEEP